MAEPPSQMVGQDADGRYSALRSNAAAVRTIASAVEGTLGPKGLDCMLVDRFGDVTITNDGAAILGKIDAQHPASRLLIHAAQAQDRQVGDGTTTATVLASALIEEGVAHIVKGVPPTRIVDGLRVGVHAAVDALKRSARVIDGFDDPLLLAAARVSARGDEEIAGLAVAAARVVPEERLLYDPGFRLGGRVVAREGVESQVIEGLLIEKERMNRQMPPEVTEAPVLVVTGALEPEKLDEEALATESGFRRHQALRTEFEEDIRTIVELGVGFVAVELRVDEVAEALLTAAGTMVIRRVPRRDLGEIAAHCGARPLMRTGLRQEPDKIEASLGHAECIVEDEGLGPTRITGGRGTPTATIVVGAGTVEVKEERRRIAADACSAVQAALKGGVLPGGGAAEIGAIPAVRAARDGVAGTAAYGVDAVGAALRAPLAQIVTNAGFSPLEKVEEVVARQAAKGDGALAVDCDTGEITDMVDAGVVDPAPVKVSALRTASEIAEAVLRINVVIRMRESDSRSAER